MTFNIFSAKSKSFILTLSIFCLGISACSSSSSPSLQDALTNIESQLATASSLIGDSSSEVSLALAINPQREATGIASVWATTGVASLFNGADVTLQEWFEDEFDPSFVNENNAKVTFAGRISNALKILCYMAWSGLPLDSDLLPAVGTYDLNVTDSMQVACDGDENETFAVNLVVTAVPGDSISIFDKYFVAKIGDSECPAKFYIRNDFTNVNIATAENQTCDGRDMATRAIVVMEDGMTRFEYISQAFSGDSNGFEYYRGYVSESGESRVLGIYGGDDIPSLTNYVAYTASGDTSGDFTTALSVRLADQTIPNGDYNGCVSSSTGAIVSDNSLECTGATGTDISSAFGVISSQRSANSEVADLYDLDASVDISFSGSSDIFTP
jgi:hypothetical protein